jgi:hypothetical protein
MAGPSDPAPGLAETGGAPPAGTGDRVVRLRRHTHAQVRLAVAFALIVLAAAGYVAVVAWLDIGEVPQEQRFGTPRESAPLEVYLEPASVDPTNYALYLRVSVSVGGVADDRPALPDRDLLVTIAHDQTVEQIEVRANQLVPTATIVVNLNEGYVTGYPFDAYGSELRVRCLDRADATLPAPRLLPVHVAAWEGALGYHIRAREMPARSTGEVGVRLQVRRSAAFVFFALAAYAIMAVLAISALTIGVLVFAGIRRIEATTMGALGAVVFALPALRNAMPGGPPLGVHADVAVFLWAEIAAVLSFALFVYAWAHRGPKP